MIHYDGCPICHSGNIQQKFSAKDYTVTGETYMIFQCNDCRGAFTQNVPEVNEIGKYYASVSYISHSDTNEGLVNQVYHTVRKKTLQQKKDLIVNITGKPTGNLLDIGCGTGAFLHTMQQAGWQTTGLEPDETARRKAAELYQINPLPSGELFSLPAEKFDAITMWHVLEHVHELHEYVAQIKALLKPGGRLIVAVPNFTSPDALHYQQYWAALDVPRHLYHFSPASMKALMKLHGLEVLQTKPMWFDSFYVSMLSEQYRRGKGNIVGAFLNGFVSNAKAVFDKEKCSSVIYIIRKKAE